MAARPISVAGLKDRINGAAGRSPGLPAKRPPPSAVATAPVVSRARPTVERGRISVPGRGTGRTFMFNPNDISDEKGISWGSIEVPGASHPVYQFGAGGERIISFELYIDGDRGRFGRTESRNVGSLSIKDELHWYRSLVYPTAYGSSYAQVAPYLVLFSFGELYNGVNCIVKKANWKVNYWVPTGPNGSPTPVRGTVSMQLGEVVTRSQTANDILSDANLTAYEV